MVVRRKKKVYVWVVSLLAILLTACVEDPEPPQEVRFSVLGDSYSTFEGYVMPDSNLVWYCPPPDNFINVTSVEEMWWHQVAAQTGWNLEMNNSFSGSLVCNMDYAHFYGKYSFLRRMDNLGNPDVIFVFGGTNDVWDKAPLGDFVYDNWTAEQLCCFRPALACLFTNLNNLYPQARVYFMLDMNLGNGANDVNPEDYKASVHEVAAHCGVDCIDLYDIHKDWGHPDRDGQQSIAEQVMVAIGWADQCLK